MSPKTINDTNVQQEQLMKLILQLAEHKISVCKHI